MLHFGILFYHRLRRKSSKTAFFLRDFPSRLSSISHISQQYLLGIIALTVYVFYYSEGWSYDVARKREIPLKHKAEGYLIKKEAVIMLKKFLEFIEEYYEEFSHSEKWSWNVSQSLYLN